MDTLWDIWPEFTTRYEAAEASLRTYRQKYDVFLKWVAARNREHRRNGGSRAKITTMGDVTREVAEEYARHVFRRKATARKDLDNLRRIWGVMLPDLERNPWNVGLHLRPPLPKSPCNYRPLALDEARRFIRKVREYAERGGALGVRHDRRLTAGPAKYLDLADAAVFAWHYGMRMGSLVSIDWGDLATWRRGFFLHVPPKTRYSKPWPLEIPVVGEVRDVLVSRERLLGGRPRGLLFPSLAAEHRRCAPNLSSCIKGVFTAAGIRNSYKGRCQMHSFRASFITQMDEAGAPAGITDAITGHAPRSVHDMYSHARAPALKRWLDRAIPDLL